MFCERASGIKLDKTWTIALNDTQEVKMTQSSSSVTRARSGLLSLPLLFGSPKTLFFLAAVVSFFLSVGLWFSGDRERGLFVGIWVPSILSAGSLVLMRGRHD